MVIYHSLKICLHKFIAVFTISKIMVKLHWFAAIDNVICEFYVSLKNDRTYSTTNEIF